LPYGFNQFVPANDAVAADNKIVQKIERLRLQLEGRLAIPQFAFIEIGNELVEYESHA
jgi:hypothetical protein